MKGDFSRGIHPDRQRGRSYRRVLLQQRRLLLDSDLAAMVDAGDQLARDTVTGLSGESGSPDLGFLLTPGKLHALFDSLAGVHAQEGVDYYRDHDRRYLGRFPSLCVRNTATSAGQLNVPLKGKLSSGAYSLVLWTWSETTLNIEVSGGNASFVSVSIPASEGFARVVVNLTASSAQSGELLLRLPAGTPAFRVGLIEGNENSGPAPYLWAAYGQYHVRGLTVENPAYQAWPGVSFPASAGFPASDAWFESLAPNTRLVAYLEAWERGITHIEDRGVREEALGGGQDTTVRTQAVGQVKLAPIGSLTPEDVRFAFLGGPQATATLDVDVQEVEPEADPCALPMTGGYTGRDNRLYWMEVHEGGGLGTAVLKWSRDNAAELYGVTQISGSTVTMALGSDLRDGDLVEVLSEVIDLGDAAPASLGAGKLTLSRRMVGVLAKLVAQSSDEQGQARFRLVSVNNPTQDVVPNDPLRYGADGSRVKKVRRWHGLIQTQAAGGADPHNRVGLEDGLAVILRGTFEVGTYWQYEARRGAQNANGAWQSAPHGPERFCVPLAVLRKPATAAQPVVLEAWLDERYPRLGELDADDIRFGDERSFIGEATVQEALEALLTREPVQTVLLDRPGGGVDIPIPQGAEITADQLADGLILTAAQGFGLRHATDANCTLTLELPLPFTSADQALWGTDLVGYQPITLHGTVSAEGNLARWRPTASSQNWLLTKFSEVQRRDDAWELYGSQGSGPSWGWEKGPQEQLIQRGTSQPLFTANFVRGFWAINRQFAAHETVVLRSKWLNAMTSPSTIASGLVFDWRNSSNFSLVVYEHALMYVPSGTGSYNPNFTARLHVHDVRNGYVQPRHSHTIVSRYGMPPSAPHPLTLSFGPDGISFENTGAEEPALKSGSVDVKANLKGQRVGLYTSVPAEFWRLESTGLQGTQPLLPAVQRRGVRARLSLKRDGVRWLGRTSSEGLPFHKDYETWFWVLPSPASPYGYGGGFGSGFSGIGAGLIK
ncbi:hypothetical protein HPC49_12795 [Pyxidicoccus fallax]|uniref:Uncharacterized protein n=1 Tax=Pyxidicoccus fallax TaxID=394095 RepID=A0A848LGX2_9BACT|nr:DUF6519 domain-containing protein [Pyxidicoccus fallax]NMO15418.1 hypothetical protein [Pyxidicoccus fallax]NPC79113.1 hypothetical protein [Pyxidicoccus fallax]